MASFVALNQQTQPIPNGNRQTGHATSQAVTEGVLTGVRVKGGWHYAATINPAVIHADPMMGSSGVLSALDTDGLVCVLCLVTLNRA